VLGIPCWRRTRSTYSRLEHDAMTAFTLSVTFKLSWRTTPRAVREFTHLMSGSMAGNWMDLSHAVLALKIISWDLERFNFRLFVNAQRWMCFNSFRQLSVLAAGMTRYVSSANLMTLPGWRGSRSAAVTMNEAGPRDEPWMTLAILLANEDVSAPNFVSASGHRRSLWSSCMLHPGYTVEPFSVTKRYAEPCRKPCWSPRQWHVRTDILSAWCWWSAGGPLFICVSNTFKHIQCLVFSVLWNLWIGTVQTCLVNYYKYCIARQTFLQPLCRFTCP